MPLFFSIFYIKYVYAMCVDITVWPRAYGNFLAAVNFTAASNLFTTFTGDNLTSYEIK